MGAHDGRLAPVTGGALGIGKGSHGRSWQRAGDRAGSLGSAGVGSAGTARMPGSDLAVDGGFAALSGFQG